MTYYFLSTYMKSYDILVQPKFFQWNPHSKMKSISDVIASFVDDDVQIVGSVKEYYRHQMIHSIDNSLLLVECST